MSARHLMGLQGILGNAGPVPARLGKYIVTGVLGEGAMGVVYKALDPDLDRPVAIKTIRRALVEETGADPAAGQRFRTEAQAAARLSHPGIVPVYEYGEDGDRAFIAMEFVEGWTLSSCATAASRLPVPDVVSILAQLLDALHEAHVNGVCHRDIKPANVLLTAGGRVKLTDFGIARIATADGTHNSAGMGSPGYMAPESYSGDAPDARVDVFACGVLLYELLAGVRPFRGSPETVMRQVLKDAPMPVSRLPIEEPPPDLFDSVISRALAKRPDDRFPTARAMRDALLIAYADTVMPFVSAGTMARLAGTTPDAYMTQPTSVASAPRQTMSIGPETLAQLEPLLARHLGPVARVVLRRTASQCTTVAALVARVAHDALGPADRREFIADAGRVLGKVATVPSVTDATGTSPTTGTSGIPVLGLTPLQPDVKEKAERVLAHHVGPIAKLMVASAARISTTREQFHVVLANLAAESTDREALLAELAKKA